MIGVRLMLGRSLVGVGSHCREAVVVAMVHVLGEGARVGEPFPALPALKRLLPAVKTLVLGQVVFVLKRFCAQVTREWTGTWIA